MAHKLVNGEFLVYANKSRIFYFVVGLIMLAVGFGFFYWLFLSSFEPQKDFLRLWIAKYLFTPLALLFGGATTWFAITAGESPILMMKINNAGITWRSVLKSSFEYIPWPEIESVESLAKGQIYLLQFNRKQKRLFDKFVGQPNIHQSFFNDDVDGAAKEFCAIPEFKARFKQPFA